MAEGQQMELPRHRVGAGAVVQDEQGRVLLVRTIDRSDTWEPPGGLVEEHESLDAAAEREVLEETGFRIAVTSVAGIYFTVTSSVLVVMFRARLVGGDMSPQAAEILEVQFAGRDRLKDLVVRPNLHARVLDALRPEGPVPYEVWHREPRQLLRRLDSLAQG